MNHLDHIIEYCERLITLSDDINNDQLYDLAHEIKATAELMKAE